MPRRVSKTEVLDTHLALAAAWLVAAGRVSTHVSGTEALESLAEDLWPADRRDDEFPRLVADVRVDFGHIFADRASADFDVTRALSAEREASVVRSSEPLGALSRVFRRLSRDG